MALADPQSVTINAIANSLPRIPGQPNSGAFQKDDGNLKLSVSHAYGKRTRRQIRIDLSKIAADPLISAQNIKYSMSAYLVIDAPITGFSITEQKQLIEGFLAWMTASSAAKLVQVLGGEA